MPSFAAVAAVGIGAALGAWLRWVLGGWLNPLLPPLPLGTLTANLVGGYGVGLAVAYFAEHWAVAPEWRLFLITGVLGGLTTFSTFSAEAVALLSRAQYGWWALHTVAHLAGSLAMTLAGILTWNLWRG